MKVKSFQAAHFLSIDKTVFEPETYDSFPGSKFLITVLGLPFSSGSDIVLSKKKKVMG